MLKRRYQPKRPEIDQSKIDHAASKKRMRNSAFGIGACAVGLALTVYFYPLDPTPPAKNDAPPSPSTLGIPDTSLIDDVELVPTGTSTIPHFPKTIHLSEIATPKNTAVVDQGDQEYQLVGLGIRTVSFLSIQVYVVGMYIAVPDIAKLQERLVRVIDPVATTLVAGEKGQLKEMLLDKEKSEEIWNKVLKDGGIRTAFRIVPTRNTDFLHLRDGWIRGITSKTQHFSQKKKDDTFSDESFGASLTEFKTVIGGGLRKKIPWGETILLTRDGKGVLGSWYEDKNGNKVNLGEVADERISRLVWLIYLGGANHERRCHRFQSPSDKRRGGAESKEKKEQEQEPKAVLRITKERTAKIASYIRRLLFSSSSAANSAAMVSAKEKAQKIIDDNGVVVFSKSYCPYCKATKSLLDSKHAKYFVMELDHVDDGADLQDALQEITGQRSVPNIFISQKHIGGNSDIQAKKGELDGLLEAAGAV